jgi:cytoskeletal protein RodZ
VTLDRLAEETKIPRARLATFEQEGFRPAGDFYQRAQIRAYAQALSLDERLVLEELSHDSAPAVPAARAETPGPQIRNSRSVSVPLTIGAVVTIALVASALLTRESPVTGVTESTVAPARNRTEPPVNRVQEERNVQTSEPASRATAGITEPDEAPAAPAVPAVTVTELVISSQPQGARVTVDGVGWGVTPVTIRHLPAGPKRIRLTSDGYTAAERVVQVHPDRASQVTVQLRSASPSINPADGF